MIGIQRQFDVLGRITIPIEYRKYLNIKTGDKAEIVLTDNEEIIIKKVSEENKKK